MLHLQKVIITSFVEELKSAFRHNYGLLEPSYPDIIAWSCHLALENIANCNALYHNVEHTIMVTAAGQEILRGKHMLDGGIAPRDWLQFTLALLFHDIGYVRGLCKADTGNRVATGVGDEMIELPAGGTDAALAPYHVDRGKQFIRERFGGARLLDVDIETITSYIEMTRFPIPPDSVFHQDTTSYAALVRAADFIGQLGDPGYLRKLPALFYELEETGANTRAGYKTPACMRESYARFYWRMVSPYIQEGLRCLRVTQEGNQWIASLNSHLFAVEHEQA